MPLNACRSDAELALLRALVEARLLVTDQLGGRVGFRVAHEALLRRCVEQRDALPRAIDVRFHDYMADQMGTIQKVYDLADLELTDTARARVERYLQDNPRGKYGQVAYDLRGDFGLDPDALWERFAFYTERFDVEREVK